MTDETQSSLQNIEEEASVSQMSNQSMDEVSSSSEGQMNVPDYSDHQEQEVDSNDADQTEINDEDMIRKGTVTSARFNILSTMVSRKEFFTPTYAIIYCNCQDLIVIQLTYRLEEVVCRYLWHFTKQEKVS
jgi:hypothetical protein